MKVRGDVRVIYALLVTRRTRSSTAFIMTALLRSESSMEC